MMPRRVVKVGGSLFDWPVLPRALRNWLADNPPAVNVLIPGGGAWADAVRVADSRFSLGEETSHWLCIDAMAIAARLLAAALPEARLLTTFRELQTELSNGGPGTVVFDVREYLREYEGQLPDDRLPRNWSVTSDSIAARLAGVVGADELVLLKSTDAPAAVDEWPARGFVDDHFAIASKNLCVRATNLRRILAPGIAQPQN